MKIATPVLILFFMATALNGVPPFEARMISTTFKQCRREQSGKYDVYLQGTLEIENASRKRVLVSRTIALVRTVSAASSLEDAMQKKYLWVMNQEFGANSERAPRLADFVTIKPGERGPVQVESITIPASIDANDPSVNQLRSGKYWLRLEFAAIPESFPWSNRELATWKRKWSAYGTLITDYTVTEPFPVDVALDPGAPTCSSQ